MLPTDPLCYLLIHAIMEDDRLIYGGGGGGCLYMGAYMDCILCLPVINDALKDHYDERAFCKIITLKHFNKYDLE